LDGKTLESRVIVMARRSFTRPWDKRDKDLLAIEKSGIIFRTGDQWQQARVEGVYHSDSLAKRVLSIAPYAEQVMSTASIITRDKPAWCLGD